MNIDIFPSGAFPKERHAAFKDHIGDGWVGDETERFFRGRDLADVTCETLSHEYKEVWWAAHNYLNEEAYLFFLPAFLKIALKDYLVNEGARVLADALAHGFFRMAKGEQDHRLLPILRGYSREQLGEIAQFLRELSRDRYKPVNDCDDAEPALELFWKQYLN
ncbi:MAG: hypothetical protein U1E12_00895 [Hydrogenophaga sp.]|uniref:hypothetical protein n=1 Tax=Hydrogenophaga sp. TaxID=1904254 RepID=UPI002ABC76A7|nr:hypothetical protein [Hydrogenophaga sp.]MDZ4100212.1 hypothetical protein [Hydrogenophaga sp.]